ncbi:MAG: hypothetical protein AB7N24_09495 [Dehalococcoidia bacterium]
MVKSRRFNRLFSFALLGVLGISGAMAAGVSLTSSESAMAASVTPVIFDATNPTCDDIEGTLAGGQNWIGVSTGNTPSAGQVLNVGGGTVTITSISGNPLLFSWTSTIGIDAVIVKNASSNHYVYVYAPNAAAPESFGDTGLGSNVNPGSISHAVFCYDVTDPPGQTPPTNTPTNTPTDTPTNTPTNTPTDTPTNTPTNTPTPSVTNVNQTQVVETPTNTPTSTNTPVVTNTPTNTPAPTNTPTNTPVSPTSAATSSTGNSVENTPTHTPPPPTNTVALPTATQPISIVEGEKTPGPTPQAPSTGNSPELGQGLNLLVAIAGLAVLCAGSWVLGASKRS